MRALLVVLIAIALGIGAAEYSARSFPFRKWLGAITGRGELQTLVGRRGIYDTDVERAWLADLFNLGEGPQDVEVSVTQEKKRAALQRLIGQAKLDAAAQDQPIQTTELEHELSLLRWQFPDERTWTDALHRAGLSGPSLRHELSIHLRDAASLEARITPYLQANDTEARRYFGAHSGPFQQPSRWRASQIFLAAPQGYPPEVIDAKRKLITELSHRLRNGESFSVFVTQFSEDERTRQHEGDLGYFSATRMLPAVVAAVQKMRSGETSLPVRSRLGFHILRLTESLPPLALTFQEARPEIDQLLANQKRTEAVGLVMAALH